MAEYIVSIVDIDGRLRVRPQTRPWTYDEMMCHLSHTVDATEYGSVAKEAEFIRNQQEEIDRLTKLSVKAYELGYADGLKDGAKNG